MVDKARLMDRVRDLGSFADPVDYIAEELGREKVAFIIGKEKASRRKASAEFQSGQRTYAVISSAGSTGINLDQRVKTALGPGHGRRVFLDVQYEWSAREALQRYGRVDRASSIAPPHIVPITFGQAAEKKFLATIANRMAAVGALSKGGAESTGAAGAALEEFEITGDDALAAARRAFEESDEPTRRSFATVKSAFRDPNRNGRAPDQPDFDPFKPSATAHGVPMTDFQLPLLLMPQAQANAFWEKFIRYRDELRAESGERNTMRAQRFAGEIIETHPLKPNLDLYAVKNSEGRQFGILVGLITPEMPKLRELLKGANANSDTIDDKDWSDTADVRFRRRYVTFTAGDQNITGLQIPWSRIPRVADAYGTAVAGDKLDTPEAVRAYLHTGESITLAVVNPDSGKHWTLRWMPGKQRIAIDYARMADRAQLLNNGAEYHPVGSYWAVKDLAKFLERWPVPDQVSAAKAPTKKPLERRWDRRRAGHGAPRREGVRRAGPRARAQVGARQLAAVKSDIRALFAPDTMGTPATVFAGTMRANLAAHRAAQPARAESAPRSGEGLRQAQQRGECRVHRRDRSRGDRQPARGSAARGRRAAGSARPETAGGAEARPPPPVHRALLPARVEGPECAEGLDRSAARAQTAAGHESVPEETLDPDGRRGHRARLRAGELQPRDARPPQARRDGQVDHGVRHPARRARAGCGEVRARGGQSARGLGPLSRLVRHGVRRAGGEGARGLRPEGDARAV
jgi:hypothetical protein